MTRKHFKPWGAGKSRRLCAAAVAGAALVAAIGAQGASAAMLASTFFENQYNGDTYPVVNGYTEFPDNDTEGSTWAPSSDGNVLSWQQIVAGGGHFQSDDWDADNATGWTIEFRIRILDDADDDPGFGVFQAFAKDITGTNSQGRRAGVSVGKNATYISSRGFLVADENDNTDGFHVFRFGQLPSSNIMIVWRDGEEIFNGASRTNNDSSSLVKQMWWGDGSSGLGGPTVEVDYFRWTAEGLFEPVPEPGTLVLAAMAVATAGAWSVRRRTRGA